MPAVERIGRCEWCGRVDHHLERGQCPHCRPRVREYRPHDAIRRAAERRREEERRQAPREPARPARAAAAPDPRGGPVMAAKCPYYYRLRELGLVRAARLWLRDNPPPKGWKHSAWRWAHEQMPTE